MIKSKFNIYPEIQNEQCKELKESIKKGYDNTFPIVIYKGSILDGWNRYNICKELNIEPAYKEFEGDDNQALEFVINSNKRRDLTASQRAAIAVEYEVIFAEEAKKRQVEAGGDRKSEEYKQSNKSVVASLPQGVSEPKPAPKSRDTAAKMVGAGSRYVSDAKKIKEEDPEEFQKIMAGDLGINEYKTEKKKAEQIERREELKQKECALPSGIYNVIYVDPPWEYENSGFKMSAESKYPTMSIEELERIDIGKMSHENSILFCWVTNPLLKEGIELITKWGFTYKTNLCWIKSKHTAGFYVYGQHELLLIGIKGSGMTPHGEKFVSVIHGDNSIHSKKPEIAYEIIEKMYPNMNYLELFARKKREGWDAWGNEL